MRRKKMDMERVKMNAVRDKQTREIVQFNWRRHWKKKVEPHLQNKAVQVALDFGMKLYDPDWESGALRS